MALLRRKQDYLDTLEELAGEIRETRPEASHQASIWIGVGLRMAAELVERRRVETLTERIVDGLPD